MGIYGNYLLLEKDKDEKNRGVSGHVYKTGSADQKYYDAVDTYMNKNDLGDIDFENTDPESLSDKQMNSLGKVGNAAGALGLGMGDLSSTSVGKDINDSELQTRIETFDKKKAEELLRAKDIVTEYNIWIDGQVDQIMASGDKEGTTGGVIRDTLKDFSEVMEEGGLSKQEVRDYLKGTYFYTSDDPDKIKLLLKLRISYCNHITKLLQEMVKSNYKLLGYSKDEVNLIVASLGNNDKDTVRDLRKRIVDHKDAVVVKDGEIDFSKLGGGKIYFTDEEDSIVNPVDALISGEDISNEDSAILTYLQKSFRYKAIILAHGAEIPKEYQVGQISIFDNPLAKNFVKLCREVGMSDKEIEDYYNDPNRETLWYMTAVKIGGHEQRNVDWCIADVYMGSNKKENTILLQQCNPGHLKIHPVFHRVKDLRVTYSDNSNWMESTELTFDDVDTAIHESEWDLMNFAESNGIDYDNLDTSDIELDEAILLDDIDSLVMEHINPYLDEFDQLFEQVLIEGKFTDAIKEFAHKAVETIVKVFKKLWEIVKGVFQKIKDFFTGNKSSSGKDTKLKEPMKVEVITTEAAKTKEYSISSKAELEKIALDNIKKLESEISKRQKEQTDATKKLDEYVQKQAS